MKAKRVPVWISAPFVVGAFAVLVWWERRRPLRQPVEPKLRRTVRNLTVAGLGAAAVQVAGAPILGPLTRTVERRRWGLLRRLNLPVWLEIPLALALLDYSAGS